MREHPAIWCVLTVTSVFAAGIARAEDSNRVAAGRYLATVADCAACHTDPKTQKPFAGGRPIETPFGTVVAPNITPDRETGIGAWSDELFDDAVRHGRIEQGKFMYPAMPFPYYTKMTREDVLAIRAYLNTVPPVRHEVESNKLPFPYNIRSLLRFWDALYFDDRPFKADPSKSAQWNRGAYLVQGPGHCGACHTPKNFLGGDRRSEALHGYAIQGWFAPDLTGDPNQGLGRWSEADIVDYLKKGHNRVAGATGPMGEEVEFSSSQMRDDDLAAIAAYLKSQPGKNPARQRLAAGDPAMVAGAAIYRDLCSACHTPDGHGVAYLIPDLANSSAVAAPDPQSALRVIIEGAQTVATQDEPTAPIMPSFGWQLSDAEIAAVTTYVRNSWGHAAPAVTVNAVHKVRRALTAVVN